MRVPSSLLVFRRPTIHFCFCHQVDRQEYSEFRKSALLALSALAISKNGQLGIFQNSEYRTGKVALDLYTTEILIFNSLTPFAVIIPLIACLTYQTNGIRIGLADTVADKKLLKRRLLRP